MQTGKNIDHPEINFTIENSKEAADYFYYNDIGNKATFIKLR
ncbi:MAG: hypothetical protein ACOC1O_04650 [bacterium]